MSQRIKQRYLFFLFVILCPLLSSLLVRASSNLDDRLYEVEKKLSGKKPVRAIDADLIKMGGVVHFENTMHKSEPYKQGNDDTPYDFGNLVRADWILAGDINPKLEFLTASSLFYLSSPTNMTSANRKSDERYSNFFLYKMYGLYKHNRYFKVIFGRMIAPAGVYMETYSPASDMYDFPAFVQSSLGGGLLYNILIDGVNIHGSAKAPGGKLTYYLYSALQAAFSGQYNDAGSFSRYFAQGYPDKPFVGARLKYSFWRNKIHLGLNYQTGQRNEKFQVYGTDISFKYNRLQIKAEYMQSKEEGVASSTTPLALVSDLATQLSANSGAGSAVGITTAQSNMAAYLKTVVDSDKKAWYVEPTFRMTNKLTLMGRYDFIDLNSPLFDNGSSKKLMSLGVIYDPYPQLRLRITGTKVDYKSSNAYQVYDVAINQVAAGAGAAANAAAGGGAAGAAIGAATESATIQNLSSAINGNSDQVRINGINPDYWQYQLSATLSF